MYFLKKNKNIMLKVVGFLLIFHTTLFAGNAQIDESLHVNNIYNSSVSEKNEGLEN